MKKVNSNHSKISTSKSKRKEKEHRLYSNSVILKELVSESNKKNFSHHPIDTRDAHVSNYGHYICLFDGFNSDMENTLEINFPIPADLSLTQKNGFTIFFWCLLRKTSAGVHRFIVKKGGLNEDMTPAIGILPNGSNLFIKLNTSKGRTESLFSSKTMELERLYNIAVTFEIDFNNDLTDIALYIDGLVDSQITVPGEPAHNQGHLAVGKPDNISYGFKGWIADIIIAPKPLRDDEILSLGSACIENLMKSGSLKSYFILEHQLEYETLLSKYSEITGVPQNIVQNMGIMNNELKEVLKHYNIAIGDKVEEIIINPTEDEIKIQNLQAFIPNQTTLLCISVKNLYTYSQFVFTIIHLCCTPNEEIELSRVTHVLSILYKAIHVVFHEEELKTLTKLLDAYTTGDLMKCEVFFKNLRSRVAKLFPELSLAVYSKDYSKSSQVDNHERLILSMQGFKNIDYEFQRDLAKCSFSAKSYYNRCQSGSEINNNQHHEGIEKDVDKDIVNQNKDGFNDDFNSKERIGEVDEEMEYNDENFDRNFNKPSSQEQKTSKQEKNQQIISQEEGIQHNIEEKVHKKKESGEGEDFGDDYALFDNKDNEDKHSKKGGSGVLEKKEDNNAADKEKNNINNKQDKGLENNNNNNLFQENKVTNDNQISEPHENKPTHNGNDEDKRVASGNNSGNAVQNNHNNNNHEKKPSDSNTLINNKDSKTDKTEKTSDNPEINNDKFKADFESSNQIENSHGGNNFSTTKNYNNNKIIDNTMKSNSEIKDKDKDKINTISSHGHDQHKKEFEIEAKYPENWNQGLFEVIINRCFDCHKHKTTTKHCEYEYVDKFNEIADQIILAFPNAKVIGNFDKLSYYGQFDVYLRGVGHTLDSEYRNFIFNKRESRRFPSNTDILDTLIALSMLYGSSVNMELSQTAFMKEFKGIFKPSKFKHEYPAELTSEAVEHRQEKEKLDQFRVNIYFLSLFYYLF